MNIREIFKIDSEIKFRENALAVFRYQYENILVYKEFCDFLKVDPKSVNDIKKIPFLPIEFFKSRKVFIDSTETVEKIFTSSGTTGSITSKHYVKDLSIYETSFLKAFELFYSNPEELVILALLPSYLERDGSSLIYMVDDLIKRTKSKDSGFYLDEIDVLIKKLELLEKRGQKTILLGVSYALLDLIEEKQFELKNTIIMETGGMKGKRKEMVKEELHEKLKNGFGVQKIHSEYGMTELLSQAYSNGNGIYSCPPWMKILTRDPEDSLTLISGKTGGINIIDLANVNSCAFIATQDLGKVHQNGDFEIMGRFDSSDIRGCNLMVI